MRRTGAFRSLSRRPNTDETLEGKDSFKSRKTKPSSAGYPSHTWAVGPFQVLLRGSGGGSWRQVPTGLADPAAPFLELLLLAKGMSCYSHVLS